MVLHQGDQRRNDQCRPFEEDCRELVANGFPRPRGEQRQGGTPLEEGLDDLFLTGTKGLKAEMFLECLAEHGAFLLAWSMWSCNVRLSPSIGNIG